QAMRHLDRVKDSGGVLLVNLKEVLVEMRWQIDFAGIGEPTSLCHHPADPVGAASTQVGQVDGLGRVDIPLLGCGYQSIYKIFLVEAMPAPGGRYDRVQLGHLSLGFATPGGYGIAKVVGKPLFPIKCRLHRVAYSGLSKRGDV